MVGRHTMVKESLPDVYILILIVIYSALIAFGGRVWSSVAHEQSVLEPCSSITEWYLVRFHVIFT